MFRWFKSEKTNKNENVKSVAKHYKKTPSIEITNNINNTNNHQLDIDNLIPNLNITLPKQDKTQVWSTEETENHVEFLQKTAKSLKESIRLAGIGHSDEWTVAMQKLVDRQATCEIKLIKLREADLILSTIHSNLFEQVNELYIDIVNLFEFMKNKSDSQLAITFYDTFSLLVNNILNKLESLHKLNELYKEIKLQMIDQRLSNIQLASKLKSEYDLLSQSFENMPIPSNESQQYVLKRIHKEWHTYNKKSFDKIKHTFEEVSSENLDFYDIKLEEYKNLMIDPVYKLNDLRIKRENYIKIRKEREQLGFYAPTPCSTTNNNESLQAKQPPSPARSFQTA